MAVLHLHEDRRSHVVAVASKILARSGLAAVTVRDVARAAGFSTTVVSHYFHNKKELLALIFRRNIERSEEQSEAALAETGGDLKAFLAPVMPLDEERMDRWKIWLAYLAVVAAEPEIGEMQRDSAANRVERIQEILDDLLARGDILPGLDHTLVASRLLALNMGLALEVLFQPDAWPAERQHELIDSELRPLYRPGCLPPSVTPAPG